MPYIKLEDLQKIPIRIDHYDEENGNINFVLGIETAIEYAESLPKADVVEVVRCRECEFRYTKECPQFILPLDDNGFCSYGERK